MPNRDNRVEAHRRPWQRAGPPGPTRRGRGTLSPGAEAPAQLRRCPQQPSQGLGRASQARRDAGTISPGSGEQARRRGGREQPCLAAGDLSVGVASKRRLRPSRLPAAPVGLPAATNPPCSTRWPRHTPKRADFPKRSPRPAKPWTWPFGKTNRAWPTACALGSPCTKRESRFVRHRRPLQRRSRNRDGISETKKPRRSRRSETAGPEQRRGRFPDHNNFLNDVYSLDAEIVKNIQTDPPLPSLGVRLAHFCQFGASQLDGQL